MESWNKKDFEIAHPYFPQKAIQKDFAQKPRALGIILLTRLANEWKWQNHFHWGHNSRELIVF